MDKEIIKKEDVISDLTIEKLPSLISPFLNTLAESQKNQAELQNQAQMKQMEMQSVLAHKNLDHQNARWNKMFWFSVIITIVIFGLAIGEIFIKNDNNTGLRIISYAATLALGFLGGQGFAGRKQSIQ